MREVTAKLFENYRRKCSTVSANAKSFPGIRFIPVLLLAYGADRLREYGHNFKNSFAMMTITPYDLQTLKIFKSLHRYTQYPADEFPIKDLLTEYREVKVHLDREDNHSLRKPLMALKMFRQFMVESYPIKEERGRLFLEHLGEFLSRVHEQFKQEEFKVQYTV